MIFCRGCGTSIHETALACPKCGAPNAQNAPATSADVLPPGIKGWSWGAFLLNWIWALGNRVWLGLLCLVPYVGFIMVIVLGFKGREWAWKAKKWESVEHFNRVQRTWTKWALIIIGMCVLIGILAAIAIPSYQDYKMRAAVAQMPQ